MANDDNKSLIKLKHLFIDNSSFKGNYNIEIKINNLNYLDLRFDAIYQDMISSTFIEKNAFEEYINILILNFYKNFY